MRAVAKALGRRPSSFPMRRQCALAPTVDGGVTLADFIAEFQAGPLAFERLPFSHRSIYCSPRARPAYPNASSILPAERCCSTFKEHRFHCGLRDGERLFYFTNCGWMMWNWLASGLAVGATLCLL